MELYPKFIIEIDEVLGECLILSKCTFHLEMVTNKHLVKGGGWFRFDNETFTFYGDSYKFGAAKIEDIQKAIDNGNVYTNKQLTRSIANKYKFAYNTDNEIIKLN